MNLFYEARNQPLTGQRKVLDVVMNRVRNSNFPSSVCGVVSEKKQFSWYRYVSKFIPSEPTLWGGAVEKAFEDDYLERLALKKAFVMARDHYVNDLSDTTQGAIYYRTIDSIMYGNMAPVEALVGCSADGDHVFCLDIEWR